MGRIKGVSKYNPLHTYLRRIDRREVTLTFAEIEAILQCPLPESARQQKAWWSNRNKGALQARAWRSADYSVEHLDIENSRVTFRKPPDQYMARQVGDAVLWDGELVKALRRHMRLTQGELAEQLGVRQQTVSEWEKGVYQPTRRRSKSLAIVAERVGFVYGIQKAEEKEQVKSG